MRKPPVLTIEQVKINHKYGVYLNTMSYGKAQRAVQRDADWEYFKYLLSKVSKRVDG